MFNYIKNMILIGKKFGYNNKLTIIFQMSQLHIYGNKDINKYKVLWKTDICAIEKDNKYRGHERRHTSGNFDEITKFS